MTAMAERVRITADSGDVEVIAEPRDGIAVEGASSDQRDGELVVEVRSGDGTVRVPPGTDVVIGSSSGDVRLRGPLGAVSVTTTSAKVSVEDAASADVRSTSGRVEIEEVRGAARVKTKSGRVHVGRVDGELRVSNVSGRVDVDDARGATSLNTVSGKVTVHVTGTGTVHAETVSGRIKVTVPAGVRPAVTHRSVSGKAMIRVEEGDDLEITTRAVSGAIEIDAR